MTMKVLIVGALIVAFVAGYFVARAKYKPQLIELSKMITEKDAAMQQVKSNANRVMMKDNKMWLVENGIVKEMDSDVVMSNGDKVQRDGKVIKEDGTEVSLQNGDSMDMQGKMLPNGSTSN